MPLIPDPRIPSEDVYGSCLDIYNRTNDDYAIVDEFPDPRTLDWNQWQGWNANDDFVMSDPNIPEISYRRKSWFSSNWFLPLCLIVACLVLLRLRHFVSSKRRERLGYIELKV